MHTHETHAKQQQQFLYLFDFICITRLTLMTPVSRTKRKTTTATTTAATTTSAAVRSSRSTRQTATASTVADSEQPSKDINANVSVVGKSSHKPKGKHNRRNDLRQNPIHIPLCPKHCGLCQKGFDSSSRMWRHLNCEIHRKASEIDEKKMNETRFDKHTKCFDEDFFQLKGKRKSRSASSDDTDDKNDHAVGSEDCPDCLELRDCAKSDCCNHPRMTAAEVLAYSKYRRTNEVIPADYDSSEDEASKKALTDYLYTSHIIRMKALDDFKVELDEVCATDVPDEGATKQLLQMYDKMRASIEGIYAKQLEMIK
ncbi:hypothetical protein GQ42DRAFT_89854 [Ramicandelaber brevisporus]|nr:hypothetical protein GQ42DRAFT_89854 [Ramicandelaber brevisporus]